MVSESPNLKTERKVERTATIKILHSFCRNQPQVLFVIKQGMFSFIRQFTWLHIIECDKIIMKGLKN
jgi:hypothetical protein